MTLTLLKSGLTPLNLTYLSHYCAENQGNVHPLCASRNLSPTSDAVVILHYNQPTYADSALGVCQRSLPPYNNGAIDHGRNQMPKGRTLAAPDSSAARRQDSTPHRRGRSVQELRCNPHYCPISSLIQATHPCLLRSPLAESSVLSFPLTVVDTIIMLRPPPCSLYGGRDRCRLGLRIYEVLDVIKTSTNGAGLYTCVNYVHGRLLHSFMQGRFTRCLPYTYFICHNS